MIAVQPDSAAVVVGQAGLERLGVGGVALAVLEPASPLGLDRHTSLPRSLRHARGGFGFASLIAR